MYSEITAYSGMGGRWRGGGGWGMVGVIHSAPQSKYTRALYTKRCRWVGWGWVAVSALYLRTTRQRVGRAEPRVANRSGLSDWPESWVRGKDPPRDVAATEAFCRPRPRCNLPSARHRAAFELHRSMRDSSATKTTTAHDRRKS